MKRLILILSFAAFIFSSGIGSAAEIQVQTGFNYDWWDDTKDNKATQFYVPIRINGRHQDFSLSVLTGYADTHLDRPGSESSSLSHLLDTKINTSYEIIGKLPVDILIGLDLNLPTGETNLGQRDLALIMDPDLISINNFGEGFNVNPTLTFAKEWGKWVAGAGFGYIWRGKYDFSSEINITDYDPGDIFNVNGEIRYYFSSNMYSRLFGSYAWYGKDDVRGRDFYQEGPFSLFGLGLYYNQMKKWDAGLTLRGIFRDKSKFQEAPGILATEANNSHGDEWIGDISVRYFIDEKTALKSFLQGRYFTKNDYSSESSRFIGRREKFSLGLGATRILSPNIEAELDLKGFVKHDAEARFPEFRSERSFRGFSVAVTLTRRF